MLGATAASGSQCSPEQRTVHRSRSSPRRPPKGAHLLWGQRVRTAIVMRGSPEAPRVLPDVAALTSLYLP